MWKKILLSVGLIVIIIGGIEIFYFFKNKEQTREEDNMNIVDNETQFSTQYVTDNCINEWSDYAAIVQEETQEASQTLNDENRVYILRTQDDYINVYYINEKWEEVLYKVTDIYAGYLALEDIEQLEKGIEVQGTQELNQMLEDFE